MSILNEFLDTLGDIADFIEGAPTRVDKNPVIDPPKDGDWIILSEDRHVITLYHDGTKVRTITSFSVGGMKKGKMHPTPVGKFTVIRKDADHKSNLYKDSSGNFAKMSYYVQFAPSVGFHVGDPEVASHGCVHLVESDAKFLFDWAKEQKTHVWVLPKAKKHDKKETED